MTEAKTTGWFLDLSRQARAALRALEAAERARDVTHEAMRAALETISDPLAHAGEIHGKGGVSDPMRKVDRLVDMEARQDAPWNPPRWATETLEEWDAVYANIRPDLTGSTLGSGLDIMRDHYRLGKTVTEAAAAACVSPRAAYCQMDAVCDFMEYLGHARAVRGYTTEVA